MVDKLLKTKMAQLADYFNDLQECQSITLTVLQSDKKICRYVERTLHLAIESCLDIGSYIIADNNWREPVNNKDIFTVLDENGVLSQDLLPKLQKLAQLHNVLVYNYSEIDLKTVYIALKQNLFDIQKFIHNINQLL